MTAYGQLNYALVRRSPFTAAMLRFSGAMAVVGSGTFLVLGGAGILSRSEAGGVELFLLVCCAALAVSFLLRERGIKRAVLTPRSLRVELGSVRHEYPWEDVVSISPETWAQRALFNRLFAAALYRKDAEIPYVNIVLRRAIRFPQWGSSPISTRGWGLFVPGINTLHLYLEDAEGFVQDARRFLQPVDGSEP